MVKKFKNNEDTAYSIGRKLLKKNLQITSFS